MKRYFIKLAYKGTDYHGWQIQNGSRTVQGEVNKGLSTLLREDINCMGCGRTDTGVHAKQFYAHFDCNGITDNFLYKLNAILPNDIAIYKIQSANSNAHARFDAISRTYQYVISRIKDPFKTGQYYKFTSELDLDIMNKACQILVSNKDFESFSKTNTQVNNYLCHVMYAHFISNRDELIFEIKANRFLRGMVRALMGTLLDLGKHKIDIGKFKNIIDSRSRSEAGPSVVPYGLFLTMVEYPEELFKHEAEGLYGAG